MPRLTKQPYPNTTWNLVASPKYGRWRQRGFRPLQARAHYTVYEGELGNINGDGPARWINRQLLGVVRSSYSGRHERVADMEETLAPKAVR